MRFKLFFFLFAFIFASCASRHEAGSITNKVFTYKSKNRLLRMEFFDDNTCILKNTFFCPDIDENYKEIIFRCSYSKSGETIVIRNLGEWHKGTFVDIPTMESVSCSFFGKKQRENPFTIGPNYATPYQEFGVVPNVTVDTLHLVRNWLFYTKKEGNQHMTFLFKRK